MKKYHKCSRLKKGLLTGLLMGSLTSFGLFASISAQAAVMLSGGLSHEYTVSPGGQATGVLELRNTSNESAEIKIYQEDVKINNDGSTRYQQTTRSNTHSRSNAGWVNLGVDRITLAPKEKRTITYSLQIPNKSELNGSYWSTLMLEPVSKNSNESQLAAAPKDQPSLTIKQKMRYAVQVLTHISGNTGKAELAFMPPKIEKLAKGRILNVDIKNSGNRYSRPNVWLDVFNESGKKLKRLQADNHGLYAGEKEGFKIELAALQPGQYKALLAAEDNNTGQIFGSDINLTIKP